MLPGPVFDVELLTTARRKRYYATRLAYGAVLLVILWISYSESFWGPATGLKRSMSIDEMARFAENLFFTFAIVQGVMVLVLTPALVSGVIVEEKQRKTLHYLLSSPLTSGEIVLGKLAARLLHLVVFLGVGLPILSLLTLFGGVDPRLVLLGYAATFSTALFLASLAILVSTHARKVREALAVTFMLELAWLFLLPGFTAFVQGYYPAFYATISPVWDVVWASSPFTPFVVGSGGPAPGSLWPVYEMIGVQMLAGLLMVAVAVWRLRAVFRKQDGGHGSVEGMMRRLRRWRWRLRPRPACGDDAMLWKERYVVRSSGVTRLIMLLLGSAGCFLLLIILYGFAREAFDELFTYGYGSATSDHRRTELNICLRISSAILYSLWILGVGAAAASSLSSEREGDTWLTLLSTPLEGPEILRAKMVGSALSMSWLAGVTIALWTVGLIAGAVHPIGFFFALCELVFFSWYAIALGTFVSLRSKSTLRAQATTIAILAATNGVYLMCCVPLSPSTAFVLFGCTPFIVGASLLSFGDLNTGYPSGETASLAFACVVGVMGYLLAAFALTGEMFGAFDTHADRPRRPLFPQPDHFGPDGDPSAEHDEQAQSHAGGKDAPAHAQDGGPITAGPGSLSN